ncbi:response regulator transcription factor [Petrachloros mirabilis]
MNAPPAVVYIVEDDPSFRKSIERLLGASGFEIISFESANAFLTKAAIRHPACLLLDVRLPDADGIAFQRALREKGTTLPVIFMTGHGTISMGVRAMKDGAIDFLPKPFGKKDLFSAIDRALEQDRRQMQESDRKDTITSLVDTLTPREKEVMQWIITGRLNKQIAHELGIAEKTVKVHRARVMEKMKVSSLAELVRLAERAGIGPAA